MKSKHTQKPKNIFDNKPYSTRLPFDDLPPITRSDNIYEVMATHAAIKEKSYFRNLMDHMDLHYDILMTHLRGLDEKINTLEEKIFNLRND